MKKIFTATDVGIFQYSDRRLQNVLNKAREFRSKYIEPVAHEIDKKLLVDQHFFPAEIVRKGCEYGFLSFPIPEFLGGGGYTISHTAVLLEELSAGCAGIANILGAHYLGLSGILFSLDINHYERFLCEVVKNEHKGEPVLFSAAVTEPMAGTDVEDAEFLPDARLIVSAKKVSGGYVLNGRKVFISNGSFAKYNVIICAIDKERPLETWSGFIVPRDSSGFSVGRVELKMGQRACHAAELVFEDCFVPEQNRLGIEGRAMEMTEVVLSASRAPVAAIATGIARGAFEKTLKFCRNRRCGNGVLMDKQWVQMALAEIYSMLQLSRVIYLEAASLFDSFITDSLLRNVKLLNPIIKALGPLRRTSLWLNFTSRDAIKRRLAEYAINKIDRRLNDISLGYSSLAKFSCSDMAVKICLKALEIMGNSGVEERSLVEKYLRDAKLTQIYEGTNQLNRYEVYKRLIGGN